MPKSTRERKPPLTVAFAGTGSKNVEKKNVEALLDDLIKGRQFFAVIPEPGPKRGEKGVRNVWSWLDEGQHEYDQEKLDDFLSTLAKYRDEGDEVLLVLAWDDEDPTEPIEQLMADALEKDIPVKDLCRALDDLEFDETDGEDASEDEPPFVPDPPKRGKARQQGRSKSAAKSSAPDEAQAEESTAVAAQIASEMLSQAPGLVLLQALTEYVHRTLRDDYGLEPKAKPKVAVFYNDDEDSYRLAAKGRPRRGEERLEIEHEQAVTLGLVE